MNKLISVIVTSYNHAEYLPRRMESLLNQTYKNIEIIIVDDCSTDDSFKVYDKYVKYPNIRIERLDENKGYAHATNLGVVLSRGEFIMFAESDDFDEPNHIEEVFNNIIKNERIGVAFCRNNIVDENGNVLCDDYQGRDWPFKKHCSKDTLIPSSLMQRFFLMSCVIPNMSAALIRKKYFNLSGGLSSRYKPCSDWDFWCRMAKVCDFYYISRPLNNFRTHPTTVRNLYKIRLQLSEMFDLLHNSSLGVNLSFWERIWFRANFGYIGAHYFIHNPKQRMASFSYMLNEGMRYEKLILLFLPFGFIKNFYKLLSFKMSRKRENK